MQNLRLKKMRWIYVRPQNLSLAELGDTYDIKLQKKISKEAGAYEIMGMQAIKNHTPRFSYNRVEIILPRSEVAQNVRSGSIDH